MFAPLMRRGLKDGRARPRARWLSRTRRSVVAHDAQVGNLRVLFRNKRTETARTWQRIFRLFFVVTLTGNQSGGSICIWEYSGTSGTSGIFVGACRYFHRGFRTVKGGVCPFKNIFPKVPLKGILDRKSEHQLKENAQTHSLPRPAPHASCASPRGPNPATTPHRSQVESFPSFTDTTPRSSRRSPRTKTRHLTN